LACVEGEGDGPGTQAVLTGVSVTGGGSVTLGAN